MRLAKLLTLTLVVPLTTANLYGQDAAQQQAAEARPFWIFLTTGKSLEGVPEEEVQQMQQAHLENFGRLAQAGQLTSAGPMSDPERQLRGIVVINAKDEEDLKEMFTADPYVTNGYLKVEPHAADFQLGKMVTNLNPSELEELRIAVVSCSADDEEWLNADQLKALQDSEARLTLAAAFSSDEQSQSDNKRRGVLIFRSTDDAKIKELLDQLPEVASGGLTFALMPQYLAKGTIE